MRVLKNLGLILLVVVLLFAGFIIYSTLTWYDPPKEFVLNQNTNPDIIPCDSAMNILSWNIGYAGLGDDMDFFYDGGTRVRDTRQRTLINLDSIHTFLKRNALQSFFLIQEIDLHSKRSYYINELDTLTLPGMATNLALNYVVKFVPIPPLDPMGSVNSGVWSMSRYMPESSTRYSYPGKFNWPIRLFNLRRCMLVNRYPTANRKEFILINTHMSAFDDGSLKKQEIQFLKDFIQNEYKKGNYVVTGGDWNQSPPGFPLTQFGEVYKSESFHLTNIATDFLPAGWKWVYDPQTPSNRYVNEPYMPGKTSRCILDIFLVSPNVEVLHNQTFDLKFRNSDHNPIEMSFRLRSHN